MVGDGGTRGEKARTGYCGIAHKRRDFDVAFNAACKSNSESQLLRLQLGKQVTRTPYVEDRSFHWSSKA